MPADVPSPLGYCADHLYEQAAPIPAETLVNGTSVCRECALERLRIMHQVAADLSRG